MQLWVVILNEHLLPDQLFDDGLNLMEANSRRRIKQYRRREDACRSLIGQLLPRMFLRKRGVPSIAMRLATSATGKPYVVAPVLDPPITFNVSHDSAFVVMALSSGKDTRYGDRIIGVDIMKVAHPAHESFASFFQSVRSQLTPLEQKFVAQDGEAEGLRRFFWIWTLKEAYTKALGSGLGFGFQRIEYTIAEDKVTVDGVLLKGWRFSRFQLVAGADTYQGVVAESVDDDELTFADISSETWIKFQAHEFLQKAIQNLQ